MNYSHPCLVEYIDDVDGILCSALLALGDTFRHHRYQGPPVQQLHKDASKITHLGIIWNHSFLVARFDHKKTGVIRSKVL